MEGFPLFVYWAYLMPAATTMVLGVMAIERGKMPESHRFMPKSSQYFSLVFEACIPVLNIFSSLMLMRINLFG